LIFHTTNFLNKSFNFHKNL